MRIYVKGNPGNNLYQAMTERKVLLVRHASAGLQFCKTAFCALALAFAGQAR